MWWLKFKQIHNLHTSWWFYLRDDSGAEEEEDSNDVPKSSKRKSSKREDTEYIPPVEDIPKGQLGYHTHTTIILFYVKF